MDELWRDVPGYEGLYQISIDTKEGKCRRLYKNGNIRILNYTINKANKRYYWNLSKHNKYKSYQAAKWIALTYPELVENEYFDGAEIDHKDTDRLNNQPSNLRWVSRKDNLNNPLTLNHLRERFSGKNNPNYGKKRSEEAKRKTSQTLKETYKRKREMANGA